MDKKTVSSTQNGLSSVGVDTLPKTAVIVLNWNRVNDTIECLESLLPVVKTDRVSLVCCDNASSDHSVAILEAWGRRHFPGPAARGATDEPSARTGGEFVLLRTERNGGYAAGNNAALRYLLAQDSPEFVWLLNNDTVVATDALPRLLAFARQHPDAGAIGSTLVDDRDRERVQCAGGCRYLPALTLMWNVLGGRPLREVLQHYQRVRLDYVHGAAMLLPAAVLDRVGLLDERFFLYYEEADFARRLRAQGYRLAWCRESVVYHKGAVSTGGRSNEHRRESVLANYHENLSTLLFTAQHYPLLLPLAAIVRLAMKTIVFLLFRRGYLFRPLWAAYRDFISRCGAEPPCALTASVLFHGAAPRSAIQSEPQDP